MIGGEGGCGEVEDGEKQDREKQSGARHFVDFPFCKKDFHFTQKGCPTHLLRAFKPAWPR
jgi:hypothetical protein